ncbi:MAG: AMP-binding protein [Solirubrobacterales bacterium]|jgi:fatty-acyl-CoA synthase|nr:AMP-binding protein [Solirubrobacterales bacterium]
MSSAATTNPSVPSNRRADVAPWAEARTVGDTLLATTECDPDAEALVFVGERQTYAELTARALLLARGLIAAGVRPGERVGVLMANAPDTVASMHAIVLAGAVFVPINIRYRAVELPFLIGDAELTTIITSDRIDDYVDLVGLLGEALPDLADQADPSNLATEAAPALRRVVLLGATMRPGCLGEVAFLEAAAGVDEGAVHDRRSAVRLRDDALVLYTSGTTSLPRGCRITHEAIVRNWACVAAILRIEAGDRVWAPCPLFHLAAIGPMVACTTVGATLVSDTFFQAPRALELITAERATHLYPAYPPITQALLDLPGFSRADLGSARVIVNVAPQETLLAMQAAIPGATQVSLYGSTEGAGAITYNSLDDDLEARTATCGHPLPGCAVRIIDPESGTPRPVDADGEILVRSFGLFEAYLNDPEKTAAAFDEDGWYRTGDRGAVDAEGRLRFLGRLKDMFKVGGENVAAAEVEAVLMSHPAVLLAAVVAIPDQRLGEVPVAFVELRAGVSAAPEELAAHCDGRLARFKVPRHVRLLTEWPMSATKVQKARLLEAFLAEHQPA